MTGQRHERNRHAGWEYLHVAIDDATRLAYAEVCDHGETGDTVTGFLQRALAWFAARGITVREILTDNGPGYVSNTFASVINGYGLKHRRTRPYRPRTNGKAERFIRILLNEWAYRITFPSSNARRDALPAYLHARHRAHARVEDRIRCAKNTGLAAMPLDTFDRNQLWCQLVAIAADLLTFTQQLALRGHHRTAEPKVLCYQLLHVAGRIVHTGRQKVLRLQADWPWADVLTAAFRRLRALPAPAG